LLRQQAMSRIVRAQPIPTPPATPAGARRRWTVADAAYLLLRSGTGLLFMAHGLQKLFGLFGGLGDGATAPLASRMGVAGVLELVGGLILVLGFFTRPVALILAGEMLVAYVIAHLPRGAVPLQNGGELALLYALIFIFLALSPRSRV
jgi:putative oxidoreductase